MQGSRVRARGSEGEAAEDQEREPEGAALLLIFASPCAKAAKEEARVCRPHQQQQERQVQPGAEPVLVEVRLAALWRPSAGEGGQLVETALRGEGEEQDPKEEV